MRRASHVETMARDVADGLENVAHFKTGALRAADFGAACSSSTANLHASAVIVAGNA